MVTEVDPSHRAGLEPGDARGDALQRFRTTLGRDDDLLQDLSNGFGC
jgi:hypothetical protein